MIIKNPNKKAYGPATDPDENLYKMVDMYLPQMEGASQKPAPAPNAQQTQQTYSVAKPSQLNRVDNAVAPVSAAGGFGASGVINNAKTISVSGPGARSGGPIGLEGSAGESIGPGVAPPSGQPQQVQAFGKAAAEEALAETRKQEAEIQAKKDAALKAQQEAAARDEARKAEQAATDKLLEQIINELSDPERQAKRDRELAAKSQDMDVAAARALEDLRARAGVAGLGTVGATAALESQSTQESARNKTLTMAELEAQAREEAFRELQAQQQAALAREQLGQSRDAASREAMSFEANMQEVERTLEEDRNGDGMIGNEKYEDFLARKALEKDQADAKLKPGYLPPEEAAMVDEFSKRPLQEDERAAIARANRAKDKTVFYAFIKQKATEKGMSVPEYIQWRKNNAFDWAIDLTGQQDDNKAGFNF